MEKKIQIYGTSGPACDDEEVLYRMIQEGMTGIRLNLSHTGLDQSGETIRRIHRAFARAKKEANILIDMQGPEMRIGNLKKKLNLSEGQEVVFRPQGAVEEEQGACPVIPLEPVILQKLSPDQRIKLDDGRILLELLKKDRAVVLRGGFLSSRKSIAIEGQESDLPPLTEEDEKNISLIGELGITGLMQPFVRGAKDLVTVRAALSDHGAGRVRIYAKIENMRGIEKLPEIIGEADEVIIARGDLGNAMPLWELPACQKRIASACRAAGKPFMVVTQMLASMEHSPVPTRAEVSDIYNAVLDGASSVMVTGETAVGEYPAEVIRYLSRTAESARLGTVRK